MQRLTHTQSHAAQVKGFYKTQQLIFRSRPDEVLSVC